MASRRGSGVTVVYDSKEPHSLTEGSLLFSLRTDSPTELAPPPVWKRQSPIDIQTSEAQFDPDLCLSPLTINYPWHLRDCSKLENNGHTWKINVPSDHYFIRGGPLKDRYQLDQVHAHWGETDTQGSEHCLDGRRFAGEMHFVHWNEKYANISEALNHEDGLSVIGVFYKIGQHNEQLRKLTEMMEKVKYACCEAEIDHLQLDIMGLLPKDCLRYWTYGGSLTTEPFTECVTWIILEEPIEVSREQIETMRHLLIHKECDLPTEGDESCGRRTKNCRRVQTWAQNPAISSSFRPEVAGPQQSPVDISTSVSVFNWKLPEWPLELHYPSGIRDACRLVNTGHTWKVEVDDERFWIKGGPLKSTYTLDQFHAHWGSTDDCGSEHTVDGRAFAGEIHFVHWNRKYGTIETALQHRDGLAVVGVFLEIGEPHPELTKLTDAVEDIRYAGSATDILNVDFQKFLPDLSSPEYWTYPGSLTTPPYTECVVWIVLQTPVKVSAQQMNSMRSLCCYKECDHVPEDPNEGKLLQNYRPVQRLQATLSHPTYCNA